MLFAFLATFPLAMQAQFKNPSTSATRATVNKTMPVTASELAGAWAGTQTNMSGLYPGSILFHLTTDGKITMGTNQKGVYPVMGNYTISGNTITGSYKMASSGDVFSFLLAYDASSKALTGTIGMGTETTGHAKWTATRTTESLKPTGIATIAPKGTSTTVNNQPPPPPPAKITSPLGRWNALVRYTVGGQQDAYVLIFKPKGDITIARANQYNGLDIVGWGTYEIEGNRYFGMLSFFSTDRSFESWAYYYSATLERDRLIGGMATLVDNVQGEITMTFDPAPTTAQSSQTLWGGGAAYDRCPSTFAGEYYLIDARIRFYTGNDGKELPSNVTGYVSVLGSTDQKSSSTAIFSSYPISNQVKGEFKPNSETVFMLDKFYMPCYGDRGEYYPKNVSLAFINTFGLSVTVEYNPNFFTDAWKIEKIELILHFQKPDGTPHPMLGDKVISFMNSSVLLTDAKRKVTFYTDRFLMPKL